MLHLLLIAFLLFLAFRRGKWSELKEYLSTINYVVICSLYYEYLSHFHERNLWEFQKPFINTFITDSLYNFITIPLIVFVFLSRIPIVGKKKIFYYMKWVVLSALIDYIFFHFHYIKFEHKWSVLWDSFFYLLMYSFIYLYYKRPIIAIILSAFVIVILLNVFDFQVL